MTRRHRHVLRVVALAQLAGFLLGSHVELLGARHCGHHDELPAQTVAHSTASGGQHGSVHAVPAASPTSATRSGHAQRHAAAPHGAGAATEHTAPCTCLGTCQTATAEVLPEPAPALVAPLAAAPAPRLHESEPHRAPVPFVVPYSHAPPSSVS